MIAAMNLACVLQGKSMEESLPLCRETGFDAVGVWFEPVRQLGVSNAVKLISDEGLKVSSLCPSGSFGDHGEHGFAEAVEHTKQAIEMAKELKSECLCLLPGSYPRDQTDLQLARDFARRGLDEIVPYAQAAGVTIAIEPLHPMYADGFSVVATVAEARQWCRDYGLKLFIDTYHVWWDHTLPEVLADAGGEIGGFHVNDWRRDTENLVSDRAIPGEGVIDLPRLFELVRRTGYEGAAEIEIFSKRHSNDDAQDFLRRCRESLRPFGV